MLNQPSPTAQQEAVSVQQTAPPDSVTHLIRVPALTPEAARLWQPIAENRARILGEASLSNKDAVSGWSDWSTGTKVLVVIGVIVLVVFVVLLVGVILFCDENPEFCD